jgi:hypothetical protein
MEVMPNPNSGRFMVSVHNLPKTATIEVYDLSGKLLLAEDASPTNGQYTRNFDLSHLQAGMYFIQLNDGQQSAREKVVIRH